MIAFRDFVKRFGREAAVDALSLEVGRGEILALLGPNGSGKTTTLKAAAGLIRPTSGAVLIGDPLRPAFEADARRACSFLPQKVAFPDSVTGAEAIEFYRALRGVPPARARDVLQAAALNGASDRAVGTYSGGMVQRLGLAVAMLPEAEIMLLDEPTASLDPDGLRTFYDVVERQRAARRTVLFSSHQLGDAERLADRVAILVGGRLAATFTARELAGHLADRGVLRVRLGAHSPDLLDRVREVVPAARWDGHEIVVPGAAALRPRVLSMVAGTGAEVLAFTTEEGRLDAFYRELIQQHEEQT